jgi:tetratricopeptide (TPR) repeat protein
MKNGLLLLWNLVPLLIVLGILGWVCWRWLKRSEDPIGLVVIWVVTAIIGLFVLFTAATARDPISQVAAVLMGALGGLILAILWAPKLGEAVGRLFGSLYDGGMQQPEARPIYSIAEARRKRGRYTEAKEEVRKQLDRFPSDFTGLMMMAEIEAEDLKNLAAARAIVDELLAFEGRAPKNIAYALGREADWHLKLAHDREGARAALERVVQLLPDTEEAQLALQRIAKLTPEEMLAERREPRRIPVKRFEEKVGLRNEPLEVKLPGEDPAAAASKYVEHLEEFPYDNDARENLALLYARNYRRLDLAADQFEQLISFPNQPHRHVVRWLNMMADLHIEIGGDITSARSSLQRIVELFPESAAAKKASSRMAHLQLEMRQKKVTQSIKLGSYEENLGLKGGYGPKRPAPE